MGDSVELIGLSHVGIDDAIRRAIAESPTDPDAPLEVRVTDLHVKRIRGALEFRAVVHVLIAGPSARAAIPAAEKSLDSPFANAPAFDPSRIRPLPPE